MTWVCEALYPHWRQSFEVNSVLAHEQSRYQDIQLIETVSHGRVMLLDGVVQVTELDEFIYQEMIVHVPLIQHGFPEQVLIIGAGDGGVLRRVLQHRSVRRAVMVEIDEAVIRLARQYLPSIGGDAWHDPRAEIHVGDGITHVAEMGDQTFDVIIVDSTDPAGPGEVLFTEQFYKACRRVLAPGGLLVNQSGVPFMQPEELTLASRRRRSAFAYTSAYVAAVPTYVGGFMALGIASATRLQVLSPANAAERASSAGIGGQTRYWSPDIHHAAFALPPYIASLIDG